MTYKIGDKVERTHGNRLRNRPEFRKGYQFTVRAVGSITVSDGTYLHLIRNIRLSSLDDHRYK